MILALVTQSCTSDASTLVADGLDSYNGYRQ